MTSLPEIGARLTLKDRRDFARAAAAARGDIKGIGDEAERASSRAARASRGFSVLSRDIAGVGRSAAGFSASGVSGLHRAAAGMGSAMATAAKGVAAFGVGAAGVAAVAGPKLLSLASDANETASAFGVTFKGNVDQVGASLKRLQGFSGIPTAQLQGAANDFGALAKAAGIAQKDVGGFSTDLVGAGLDLASFRNKNPADVFAAISSGLSGEAEPLKSLGIFISDASMKAQAASMGLRGELTEGQKVMVRQRLIMQGLGDAAGDLARTADSPANRWRQFTGRLTEFGTQIGQAVLPAANKLLGFASDALPKAFDLGKRAIGGIGRALKGPAEAVGGFVRNVGKQAPNLFAAFKDKDAAGIGEVLDNMLGNSGRFTSFFEGVANNMLTVADVARRAWPDVRRAVGAAVDWFTSTALPAVAGFAAKVVEVQGRVVGWVRDHWPEIRAVVGRVADFLTGTVAPAVAGFVATAVDKFGQVVAWVRRVWPQVSEAIGHVVRTAQWLWRTFGDEVLGIARAVFGTVAGVVNAGLGVVRNVVQTVLALINGDWGRAWDGLKGIVGAVWDGIFAVVRGAGQTVGQIVQGFGSGIAEAGKGIWEGLKTGFRAAVNWIIDRWNGLDLRLPDWVPGGLGGKDLFPDVKRLGEDPVPASRGALGGGVGAVPMAAGGVVLPRPGGTLIRAAEAGFPEAVLPLPHTWRASLAAFDAPALVGPLARAAAPPTRPALAGGPFGAPERPEPRAPVPTPASALAARLDVRVRAAERDARPDPGERRGGDVHIHPGAIVIRGVDTRDARRITDMLLSEIGHRMARQ